MNWQSLTLDATWTPTQHYCPWNPILIGWTKWLLLMKNDCTWMWYTKEVAQTKVQLHNLRQSLTYIKRSSWFAFGGMQRMWFTGKCWNTINPPMLKFAVNNCNMGLTQLHKNDQNWLMSYSFMLTPENMLQNSLLKDF